MLDLADRDLPGGATDDDETPELAPMTDGQAIVSDYRATDLTLGRHPLALLRPRLAKMRLVPSDTLMHYRNGQLARACGIVTVRQKAGHSEWRDVHDAQRRGWQREHHRVAVKSVLEKFSREALGSSLLAVYGVWEREGEERQVPTLIIQPIGR